MNHYKCGLYVICMQVPNGGSNQVLQRDLYKFISTNRSISSTFRLMWDIVKFIDLRVMLPNVIKICLRKRNDNLCI